MRHHNLMTRTLAVSILAIAATLAIAAEPATKPAAPPAAGEKARDFSLADLDGKQVTLTGLTKTGPVVLVVLRGWPGYQCPLCSTQVGQLRAKADELSKRGARVLLVYPGPKERLDERAREFLKEDALPEGFHFVTDPDFAFVNAYGLRWDAPDETAYPSTFVIGKDNLVRFAKVSKTHGGRASVAEVLKALDDAK